MAPLVSAICLTMTPERASMLPDALRSYRQQTYSPRELVVVNQGEPLVSRAPDVVVVNLPDRGWPWSIGEKRNVGVRAARGEWLATWDDDDVSLPGRIAESVAAAQRLRADILLADFAYVIDDQAALYGGCRRDVHVAPSALLLKESVVRAGGYQPVNWAEDRELAERIRYIHRGTVVTVPGFRWYCYRIHRSNASQAAVSLYPWVECASRDQEVQAARRELSRLLVGPGGEDVVRA